MLYLITVKCIYFLLQYSMRLTAVKNIARRFPNIRQNDIVLAEPLSVEQEINVMQHIMHLTHFTITFSNFREL